MAEETGKTKSWKVYALGIALIISGISGCTVTVLRDGDISGGVTQGVEGVKQGAEVIQSGELPVSAEQK